MLAPVCGLEGKSSLGGGAPLHVILTPLEEAPTHILLHGPCFTLILWYNGSISWRTTATLMASSSPLVPARAPMLPVVCQPLSVVREFVCALLSHSTGVFRKCPSASVDFRLIFDEPDFPSHDGGSV